MAVRHDLSGIIPDISYPVIQCNGVCYGNRKDLFTNKSLINQLIRLLNTTN